MFDIGIPEFGVLLVVGLLVFGPDRLPEFARQAGRFVRQVRAFTNQARDDIRNELGPEFSDFELTDLDPRKALRKHIMEAWDDDDTPAGVVTPAVPELAEGELPPYDYDAT